jgi:predicted dehydrogenase
VNRPPPLRVGVVGAGLIAQVMHLPHLRELDDCFEVRALCDASQEVAERCARRFGIERVPPSWEALLEEDLDAVVVATSGSHEPMARAAAEKGLHLFVEKPMAYSVAEAQGMIDAAEAAGVVLMVGYPKRHDPAYGRAHRMVQGMRDLRFVRVTTAESPAAPYLRHHRLDAGPVGASQAAEWREDRARRVHRALGDVDPVAAATYEGVLLDTMVHEFNLLRGLLGEPTALRHVSTSDASTTVVLDFDGVDCVVAWIDLPGIARYEMELCFYDPAQRVRLAFPSPYLRDVPTLVGSETGDLDGPSAGTTTEVLSYTSPFKLELRAWHDAITEGTTPLTSGLDAARDIALCQSAVTCLTTGRPVTSPSALPVRPTA